MTDPCDHFPIPDEKVSNPDPPATVPVVETIGYRCAACGTPCDRKEPT